MFRHQPTRPTTQAKDRKRDKRSPQIHPPKFRGASQSGAGAHRDLGDDPLEAAEQFVVPVEVDLRHLVHDVEAGHAIRLQEPSKLLCVDGQHFLGHRTLGLCRVLGGPQQRGEAEQLSLFDATDDDPEFIRFGRKP